MRQKTAPQQTINGVKQTRCQDYQLLVYQCTTLPALKPCTATHNLETVTLHLDSFGLWTPIDIWNAPGQDQGARRNWATWKSPFSTNHDLYKCDKNWCIGRPQVSTLPKVPFSQLRWRLGWKQWYPSRLGTSGKRFKARPTCLHMPSTIKSTNKTQKSES